jgi:hypothetical protein
MGSQLRKCPGGRVSDTPAYMQPAGSQSAISSALLFFDIFVERTRKSSESAGYCGAPHSMQQCIMGPQGEQFVISFYPFFQLKVNWLRPYRTENTLSLRYKL